MHRWSDKGIDWSGIDAAAGSIGDFCRKWGRLGGQAKEKYGTVRFYANFGYLSLSNIIYPGYVYSKFPDWLWKLDCDYIGPFLRFFFEKSFVSWQKFVYNKAYWRALRKWPHLRAEILNSADYIELIKGVSRVEGKKTHILGWDGSIIATWEKM